MTISKDEKLSTTTPVDSKITIDITDMPPFPTTKEATVIPPEEHRDDKLTGRSTESDPWYKRPWVWVTAGVGATALALAGYGIFGRSDPTEATPGTRPTAAGPATPGTPSATPEGKPSSSTPESKIPPFDTAITNKTFAETQAFDPSLLSTDVSKDPAVVTQLWAAALTRAVNIPDEAKRLQALEALYVEGRVPEGVKHRTEVLHGYIASQLGVMPEIEARNLFTQEWFMGDIEPTSQTDSEIVVDAAGWNGINTREAIISSGLGEVYTSFAYDSQPTHLVLHVVDYRDPDTGKVSQRWAAENLTKKN